MNRRWLSAGAGLFAGVLTVAVLPSGLLFVTPGQQSVALATGERWACPMLDFIGDKPGNCPVCGMQLHLMTAGVISQAQHERMGIETTKATSGPATVVVHAYGAAEYDHRTTQTVIPRVAGRIVRRHLAGAGHQRVVAVGDPLIDLYSPEVFQTQGELAAAVRQGQTELITAITAQFARWNLTPVAEAICGGGKPVDTITITSPVAGQVLTDDQEMLNQNLMVGKQIPADQVLVQIVDPTSLTLVIHVPEPRARFLRVGQVVTLSADDLGELPDVRAEIGRVADGIDPKIRAREVRVFLHDGRRRLLPGSLVHARFQSVLAVDLTPADPQDPTTWGTFVRIPKTAVLSTGVRDVAWKVVDRDADGTAHYAPVSLALGPRLEDAAGNDTVLVRAGLAAGDEVVTQGAFLIDSQAQLAGSPSLLFPDGTASKPAP
jgi:membrane fusion protein, copper/silver efflux system